MGPMAQQWIHASINSLAVLYEGVSSAGLSPHAPSSKDDTHLNREVYVTQTLFEIKGTGVEKLRCASAG